MKKDATLTIRMTTRLRELLDKRAAECSERPSVFASRILQTELLKRDGLRQLLLENLGCIRDDLLSCTVLLLQHAGKIHKHDEALDAARVIMGDASDME